MAIVRTTLRDLPDRVEWREDDASIGYVGFGTDWKAGSPQANRSDYEATAAQAVDTLESAWDNWASLSAAQKDAALKLTVRVVTRLARLMLGRLT